MGQTVGRRRPLEFRVHQSEQGKLSRYGGAGRGYRLVADSEIGERARRAGGRTKVWNRAWPGPREARRDSVAGADRTWRGAGRDRWGVARGRGWGGTSVFGL